MSTFPLTFSQESSSGRLPLVGEARGSQLHQGDDHKGGPVPCLGESTSSQGCTISLLLEIQTFCKTRISVNLVSAGIRFNLKS